jgi:predicted aspartyl protease
VTVAYKGAEVEIPDILIDTGSGATILSTDIVLSIGIIPLPEDILHTIRGVGGREVVFQRTLDYVQVGDSLFPDFSVDIGGMDYGFDINGILGMDFLTSAGAIINLQDMSIKFANVTPSLCAH